MRERPKLNWQSNVTLELWISNASKLNLRPSQLCSYVFKLNLSVDISNKGTGTKQQETKKHDTSWMAEIYKLKTLRNARARKWKLRVARKLNPHIEKALIALHSTSSMYKLKARWQAKRDKYCEKNFWNERWTFFYLFSTPMGILDGKGIHPSSLHIWDFWILIFAFWPSFSSLRLFVLFVLNKRKQANKNCSLLFRMNINHSEVLQACFGIWCRFRCAFVIW